MPLDPVAGALVANANRDVFAHAANMRRSYRASFDNGHSCSLCPRIDIPPTVASRDRERRSKALWDLHWRRMRRHRWANREYRKTSA